jgi:hypothetical protein
VRTEKLVATFALAGVLLTACSVRMGGNQGAGPGNGSAADLDAYGAGYQGDGVQCGAIVCSGTQQCCLVYIPADANTAGPTHACDQDCQSICADVCPDAGGMIQSFPPSASSMPMGSGMPMGSAMPSTEGGMPMGGAMPSMGDGMPMGGTVPMPPQGGTMGPGADPSASPEGGPQDADTDS